MNNLIKAFIFSAVQFLSSCQINHPALDRIAAHLALNAIKLYKLFLSPFVGRDCLFNPTCSVFTENAIRENGWTKGIALSAQRLKDCAGGYSLYCASDGRVMMRTRSGQIFGEEAFSKNSKIRAESFRAFTRTPEIARNPD